MDAVGRNSLIDNQSTDRNDDALRRMCMPHDIRCIPLRGDYSVVYYLDHRLECRQQEETETQLQHYEEDLTNTTLYCLRRLEARHTSRCA